MSELEVLQLQSNKLRFLRPEFHFMTRLTLVGLDWFSYTCPALPVLAKPSEHFDAVECLKNFSFSLSIERVDTIDFIPFLEHFSQEPFVLNWQDSFGRTLMHKAVLNGDKTIVDLLLESRLSCGESTLNLNLLDEDNMTPLAIAIKEENQDIASRLLDQKGHKLNVNTQGAGKHASLLHLAVSKLDVKSVVKLIMREADVNQRDTVTGDTPMHLLVSHFLKNLVAARKILEFLLSSGADINAQNLEGWTPLHLAVKKGSLDIVDALLSAGSPNLDLQGGGQSMTALQIACCSNLYRIVYLLITSGADLFVPNIDGKTSLTVIHNNLLMMKIIKKAMIHYLRTAFECSSKPREHHLTSPALLKRLSQKYGGSTKRLKAMHSLRNNLKLVNHYLKFPTVVDLFMEKKFKPS